MWTAVEISGGACATHVSDAERMWMKGRIVSGLP